jgi:aryl sulfotransferase
MDERIAWPQKTREIQTNHIDSTIWNDFKFRDDDIIIATWGKAGTTWTQQIVGQMLFNGRTDLAFADMSPWVDFRVPAKDEKLPELEAQTHRRFLKTHLPVDGLVFSPKAKYLYVGRDGRDIVWSIYNHHVEFKDMAYEVINDTPGRVGPALPRPNPDIVEYFREWLAWDGYPWWPFWENVRSWWNIRHLPNVMLVHFQNLKDDMDGMMRKMAAFLDIPIDEDKWPEIVEHCTFAYMKKNATASTPLGGIMWEGGADTFVYKGVNGRWHDMLPAEDSKRYEARAVAELGPECAHWLAAGKLPEGER